MIVKGITIHNTGNDKSAQEMYELLKESGKVNLCHFLIDEKEIINTWSVETPASHTGKGFDNGNRFTLAIEICRSRADYELYEKAQKKAVKFIKKLLKEYKLTTRNIYFHNDFNKTTYCPHRILDDYGSKENFIKEVF